MQITKKKALTTFNCPYCQSAGTVKVSMHKREGKYSAECICTSCQKKKGFGSIPLIYTNKNVYMQWVKYVMDEKSYSVKCKDSGCNQLCVVEIRHAPDGHLFGYMRCPECGEYIFELLPGETREQLCKRIPLSSTRAEFNPRAEEPERRRQSVKKSRA